MKNKKSTRIYLVKNQYQIDHDLIIIMKYESVSSRQQRIIITTMQN